MLHHSSTIHNRKKPNHLSLFAKKTAVSNNVAAFLDDLEYKLQNIPNISTLQRLEIMNQAKNVAIQLDADDQFTKLCSDPKKFETYVNEQLLPSLQQLDQMYLAERKQSQAAYSVGAFVKDLAKSTAMAHLSAISPVLGILAGTALVGAEYVINNGIPQGNNNLCQGQDGYLSTCTQGYITNGTEPLFFGTNNKPIRFNTVISYSGSNSKANLGAYIALDRCIGPDTAGDAVVSALNTLPHPVNNQTTNCFVNGGQFYGYQVSAVMNNMPQGTCESAEAQTFQAIQQCMSSGQAVKWNFVIAGSIIGGAIGIVGLCVLGYGAFQCARNVDCEYNKKSRYSFDL